MNTKNIDRQILSQIEHMLSECNIDTRAAVAALALPGRIRAFSPHYAALAPKDQERLAAGVDKMMRERGDVCSATGITAALAINWCEARGKNYVVTRAGDDYMVEMML